MADSRISSDNGEHNLKTVKYVPPGNETNEKLVPEENVKKPDTLFLYLSVITVLLPWIVGGAAVVWPSSAIVKLQSNNTDINPLERSISTAEISMLLGVPSMAGLAGSSLLPTLTDIMGRRNSLRLMTFVMLCSLTGVAFSTRIELVIIFMSFNAIAFAGIWCSSPIYITEICEDHNRAKHCCVMALSIPLGELFSYIIGPLFNIPIFTLIIASPLLFSLTLSFIVPESPVYSLSKGKQEECRKALKKLRSNKLDKEIEADFNKINQTLMASDVKKGIGIVNLFSTKEGRLGVVLGLLPISVQHLSGAPIITPQLAPIFNDSGSKFSGTTIAIFVGVIKVITYIFTSLIVEKVGRKPLLVLSAFGAGLPISIVGIFFYLKHVNSPIAVEYSWVPIISILIYFITYGLGLGPVSVAVISELFPSELRSASSAVIFTVVELFFGVYLTVYSLFSEAVGTHWCMWIFGGTCFVGGILFQIMLIETKGKGIDEIQKILKNY